MVQMHAIRLTGLDTRSPVFVQPDRIVAIYDVPANKTYNVPTHAVVSLLLNEPGICVTESAEEVAGLAGWLKEV